MSIIAEDTDLNGKIIELWAKYEMPENIQRHSITVKNLAKTLSAMLSKNGISLDLDKVIHASLLHDIAKMPCIINGGRHNEVGSKILIEEGCFDIAEIVELHIMLPEGNKLDEAMVVNYSDKRVNDDKIVSLEERYQYIVKRYSRGVKELEEKIKVGLESARRSERMIFGKIKGDISPDNIALYIER